jgi:mediator of RNA polymerase II transcription subunit 10
MAPPPSNPPSALPHNLSSTNTNAPNNPSIALESALRPLVQSLYALQTQIIHNSSSNASSQGATAPTGDAGSTDASSQILQHTLSDLLSQLRNLHTTSTSSSLRDFTIPPDVVEYVQDGRNPDIYVREFVELTMRNNQRLKGKFEAFGMFRDILAEEIRSGVPGMGEGVGMVVGEGHAEEAQVKKEET